MDPDHLDIYRTRENLVKAFESYIAQIRGKGKLVYKMGLAPEIPDQIERHTYSVEDQRADYHTRNLKPHGLGHIFNVITPDMIIPRVQLTVSGLLNVENSLAAAAVAHLLGIAPEIIARALSTYRGVERRFDVQVNSPKGTYIDDYAHHPEEIKAFLSSVRNLFPERKLTGIFQPHLYSRTRDFADGFARSLELLDVLVMMEIYPAREEPIPGVSSSMVLEKVRIKEKYMVSREQLLQVIRELKPELLVTMGAGNIDQFVSPIRELYKKR
jgi:UDP-N-acetylmuramate--alanine ligase